MTARGAADDKDGEVGGPAPHLIIDVWSTRPHAPASDPQFGHKVAENVTDHWYGGCSPHQAWRIEQGSGECMSNSGQSDQDGGVSPGGRGPTTGSDSGGDLGTTTVGVTDTTLGGG